MRIDLLDILMPAVVSVAFLLLSWSYARSINRGRPLRPTQQKMLYYGFSFVLGAGYLALSGAVLRWPMARWVWLIVGWGVLLASVAWWRRKRARENSGTPRRPLGTTLAESLPMVGLLVCLIGAAIEWEFVAESQGRWLVALSWTVGVAAVIALARRNRRATVVTALRAFLGLLVIGALAQWSLSGLIAVGVTAAVLLMLEKLWPKTPKFSLGASEQEEAAISREPSSHRFR